MQDRRESMSDEELARKARAGSESSFETLVLRYERRVFLFLHRQLGNAHDAEDAAQQTFVGAYRGLDRFDPARPFLPWLFTIARRQAAGMYRARRPELEAGRDAAAAEPVDSRTPATELAAREGVDDIWSRARRVLTDEQFAVLWLRVREEFSVREAATVMGRTQASVKVLLHRARRKLAAVLTECPSATVGAGKMAACGERGATANESTTYAVSAELCARAGHGEM